jgi:hypothetical protein
MSLGKGLLFIGVGSLALLTRLVVGGETGPATPGAKESAAAKPAEKEGKPATVVGDDAIERLIEQLDSADYDTRETACKKLAETGKAAVAALQKAAANGNLEVSSRATTVLGNLLKSSDKATEKAANDALEHLAEGDSPAAARKAKSILEKKNGVTNNNSGMNGPGMIFPGNGFGGQIIINGGQLNIGVGAGGGGRTLSVKNTNGVKEITTSEEGKTVKIQDDPAKGIKVELTEKQNGKEVTKKFEAKNVEELKKQPAGYELYKKYGGGQPGNGIGQLGFGILNFQVPGNANPPQPGLPIQPGQPLIPGLRVPGAAVPGRNNPQVEVATLWVRNLSSRLDGLQKTDVYKNASPESKAKLKKEIDELSKRLEAVRGQLGDK